jgi:hypothetical protein
MGIGRKGHPRGRSIDAAPIILIRKSQRTTSRIFHLARVPGVPTHDGSVFPFDFSVYLFVALKPTGRSPLRMFPTAVLPPALPRMAAFYPAAYPEYRLQPFFPLVNLVLRSRLPSPVLMQTSVGQLAGLAGKHWSCWLRQSSDPHIGHIRLVRPLLPTTPALRYGCWQPCSLPVQDGLDPHRWGQYLVSSRLLFGQPLFGRYLWSMAGSS